VFLPGGAAGLAAAKSPARRLLLRRGGLPPAKESRKYLFTLPLFGLASWRRLRYPNK